MLLQIDCLKISDMLLCNMHNNEYILHCWMRESNIDVTITEE